MVGDGAGRRAILFEVGSFGVEVEPSVTLQIIQTYVLKYFIPVTVEDCAFYRAEKRNPQPRALYEKKPKDWKVS